MTNPPIENFHEKLESELLHFLSLNASNVIYLVLLVITIIILTAILCLKRAAFERVKEEVKKVMNSCRFGSSN
jgi:hypothetical protein